MSDDQLPYRDEILAENHFAAVLDNPSTTLDQLRKVNSLSELQSDANIEYAASNLKKFRRYFEDSGYLNEEPPRKRRKIENTTPNEVASLRLLSTTYAPTQLSLLPKPIFTISIPPVFEDSSALRKLRREQAKAAAVDARDIIQEALDLPGPKTTLPITLTDSESMPPIAYLVKEKDSLESGSSKVPRLRVSSPVPMPIKKKARRRLKAKREKPKIHATFWRPSTKMGPRASGYALGYIGSWMVDDPSKAPYERDRMRSGTRWDFKPNDKRGRLGKL